MNKPDKKEQFNLNDGDLQVQESQSWLDELILEQDEDLIEEDTIMDKIPTHLINECRTEDY